MEYYERSASVILIQGLGNAACSGLLDKGIHLTEKLTVLLVILGYQNPLEETEVYVRIAGSSTSLEGGVVFCS